MSQAITKDSPGTDHTVTRSFQVKDLSQTQEQLQDYEAAQAKARPKPCCNRVPRLK